MSASPTAVSAPQNAVPVPRRAPATPQAAAATPRAAAAARAAAISTRRLTADVVVQIVGQVLNLALGVVVTLLIVRTLGPTRFGEWSTILAMSQLLGYLANLGLAGVAVRYAAAEREREAQWLGAYTALTAIMTVPATIAFVVVMEIISRSFEMRVASLILSLTYLTTLLSTFTLVFRLRVRNHISTAFSVANSVLWTAAVVVIALAHGGLIPLALAFLAVSAVIQGTEALVAVRIVRPRLRGSRAMFSPLLRVGLMVGAGALLTVAYARIDQLLVYELAPLRSDAGLYAAMYRILDAAAFVPIALMTTLFPIISAAYPLDLTRVRRIVQLAIDYLAMVSLPVLAFSIVASLPLVHALFGGAFDRAADALPILMGAYVVICFGYISGNLVITTNLQRRYVTFAIVGLIVNVTFNLILIPSYGYLAAAWMTLATNIVVVGPAMLAVLRKLEMRPSGRRLIRIALAATVAGAAVALLHDVGVSLGGLVAVMLVVYPLALLALRALDVGELRGVLSRQPA